MAILSSVTNRFAVRFGFATARRNSRPSAQSAARSCNRADRAILSSIIEYPALIYKIPSPAGFTEGATAALTLAFAKLMPAQNDIRPRARHS